MSINNPYSLSWGWKVDPDARQDRSCGPVTTREMTEEERLKYGIAGKVEDEVGMKKIEIDERKMLEICRIHGTGKVGTKEVAKAFGMADKTAENQIYQRKIRQKLKDEINSHEEHSDEIPAEEYPDIEEIAKEVGEAFAEKARESAEKITMNTAAEVDEMMEMVPDNVNHPKHYTAGGIEVTDYIQAKLTTEQFEGFCIGVIMQYISRYRYKGGLEDLKKAAWYLSRIISVMETM